MKSNTNCLVCFTARVPEWTHMISVDVSSIAVVPSVYGFSSAGASMRDVYVWRGIPNVSVRANAHCCKSDDDYVMVLYVFWTSEVMLGRTERLASLSHAVSDMYVRRAHRTLALNSEHYHR